SHRLSGERRASRSRGLDHVVQRRLGDGLAAEAAIFDQPLRQLAPDHASRADNENMHGVPTSYSILLWSRLGTPWTSDRASCRKVFTSLRTSLRPIALPHADRSGPSIRDFQLCRADAAVWCAVI